VAGRPVLSHVLAYLRRHGFLDVGVVVSPRQEELRAIPDPDSGQRVTFIVQRRPLGIAHAVSTAARFLGQEPFLLYLGDNLTDEELTPALERFREQAPDALIAVREVADPRSFGVAEVKADRIVRVVEKPAVPVSRLAITGLYLFSPAIHRSIAALKPSARGEYEITDAIAGLIRQNRPVLAHRMTGWWQDMGTLDGILAANARLLSTMQPEIDPDALLRDVAVEGPVLVGAGAVLERVCLKGPLVIGRGSRLTDSIVGPFTSVGDEVLIEKSSVENSILLSGCRLLEVPFHLERCLLGSGSTVGARPGETISLQVGDDARLLIPPAQT
jgi:glucose-1-phosphate thymidylyltransferase